MSNDVSLVVRAVVGRIIASSRFDVGAGDAGRSPDFSEGFFEFDFLPHRMPDKDWEPGKRWGEEPALISPFPEYMFEEDECPDHTRFYLQARTFVYTPEDIPRRGMCLERRRREYPVAGSDNVIVVGRRLFAHENSSMYDTEPDAWTKETFGLRRVLGDRPMVIASEASVAQGSPSHGW